MSADDPAPKKSLRARIWEFHRQIVQGLIVAALIAFIGGGFWYLESRIIARPVNAKLANSTGQTSIRPIFDILIRPAFAKYCSEPAWIKWFGKRLWDQECRRIVFEPHELADLQTRRVDFNESADPLTLMFLFEERHKDCIKIQIVDDTYKITESENSAILRINNQLVCP
ncbi:hypothetical protein [Martelella mediterranea]|uniref:hypothetical protein n=1 Tax=Martelella mediterranea TaxID=293089 RepID=UPI0003824A58|nr:hypothetical protein [Martelella mediterranea]